MASAGRRPDRSDSLSSAVSSEGATVRDVPETARSRASSATTAAAGFLARWTGRSNDPAGAGTSASDDPNDLDQVSLSEAGPSDYWRRTPSPPLTSPPIHWKQLREQPIPEDPWSGPSDITRGGEFASDGYFGSHVAALTESGELPDDIDAIEFQKRLNAIGRDGNPLDDDERGLDERSETGTRTPRSSTNGHAAGDVPRTPQRLAFPQGVSHSKTENED